MVEARIIVGDCIEAMREMQESSIEAIVTDPPYGLGFMSKQWDSLPPGIDWAAECLRVLKPGGHLLAFGGTRTWHRLVCAIEDAGFEIRDSIAWLYGSGFPKSKNIALFIDKSKGHVNRGRAIPTASTYQASDTQMLNKLTSNLVTPYEARSQTAQRWKGWGTGLKPAFEPIVVARKPFTGTVARNVLEHGTGAINIDACRIKTNEKMNHEGKQFPEIGYAGRWPANVTLTHNPDCKQINEHDELVGKTVESAVWTCSDKCVVANLDAQSGITTSANRPTSRWPRRKGSGWDRPCNETHDGKMQAYGDTGGASRFFYVSKASKRERPAIDGVMHPTVKPLDLMRWLVRLVTPPGGTVLDPFAGSGTTLEAALLEGFDSIGIEVMNDYVPLIEARIARVQQQISMKIQTEPTLFD